MSLNPTKPINTTSPRPTSQQVITRHSPTFQKPIPMIYRKLGNSGLDVSVIAFGSWVSFHYQIQLEEAKDIIKTCFEAGINFFDTAETYAHGESEIILGQAIKELSIPRSDIVIATKIFFGDRPDAVLNARGLSRKHIIEGLKASLQRLQLDYVDIVYAHRPDPTVPLEEIVRAFNYLIDHGYAFYWGTSEWPGDSIKEAHKIAERLNMIAPVVEQPQYSILHRKKVEVEYDELCSEYGMGLTTFSPLACGILSGKYNNNGGSSSGDGGGGRFELERYKFLADRWLREETLSRVDNLKPIATKLNITPAQLALAWCIVNPHVSSVIMGATKISQIEDNLGALEVLDKMTAEVMDEIERAVQGGKDLELGKQPKK